MKKIKYWMMGLAISWMQLGTVSAQTPAIPFGSNAKYAYGFIAGGNSDAVATAWYNYWTKSFIKDCGGGKALVVHDYAGTPGNSQAYSEGQGYGMLLAAYKGDKTLFDKLQAGYFANTNDHGLMNWHVTCNGMVTNGQNGATDGDLDAAMALVIANKQWPNSTSPNYSTLATTLINNIKKWEFVNCGDKTVQKGGDWLGGCNCTNPSYYATGYYRAFGKHTGDATFWDKAAKDGLELLLKATHPTTGLNPAWTDQSGSITSGGSGDCERIQAAGGGSRNDYQFDAARTPWRIVIDYLWWGTPEAKTYLDKVTAWSSKIGIPNIKAGYQLDGSVLKESNGSPRTYGNSAFRGAFAIGAMATAQGTTDDFYDDWVATSGSGETPLLDDQPYFQNSLRTVYQMVASGNFWNPYATSDPTSVVTATLTAPTATTAITEGTPVTLTATATSTGGTITSVQFLVDGVAVNTDAAAPFTYSLASLTAGQHTITVKATDSKSATGTSAEVKVTVTPSTGSTVTVSLTAPASNASFEQGSPVVLTATASSTNSATIASVEFFVDGTSVNSDLASPYSYSTSTLTAGPHTITAKATDSNGKTATSSPVSITVTSIVNSIVTVNLTAPAGGITLAQGSPLEITATATSTEGATISKIDFLVDGVIVGSDLIVPYSFSTTTLAVGTHAISVKATDSNGKTATSTAATITVTGAPGSTVNFPQTSEAPVIDGTIDALWTKVSSTEVGKAIMGTLPASADLSATFKAIWDAQFVYVLVNVVDESKINDSPDRYNDDAVELFFDLGNDKATEYGPNDVQYTFRWNDETLSAGPTGRTGTNIVFKSAASANGYVLEVKIPWSTLQGTPAINQLIGFDVQINDDDDAADRDSKIAWASSTDDAWKNPSLFGTAKLTETINGLFEDFASAGVKVFPNPFTSGITIEGLNQEVEYSISDMSGKVVQTGTTSGQIATGFEAGLYNLTLKNATKLLHAKIFKLN